MEKDDYSLEEPDGKEYTSEDDGEKSEEGEPVEWDGSEAEIVLDDESEDYEGEVTGIKIKYFLNESEVLELLTRSENYVKERKKQIKNVWLPLLIFAAVIILGTIFQSRYYLLLSIFPLSSVVLAWFVPYFAVKKAAKTLAKEDETCAEFFPDHIEITNSKKTREIPLDGSFESETHGNMILIFSQMEGVVLVIPLRAIEPDFLPEIQAMIYAGMRKK